MSVRSVAVTMGTILGVAAMAGPARAQNVAGADTARAATLRVFLDCRAACDFDHLRREITFVDWMRDRQDAQVHVLVTQQSTGAGSQFLLTFIGLRNFSGVGDTLRYAVSQTDTDTERRDAQTRVLALGLMRYVARSPLARRVTIGYDAPGRRSQPPPGSDPWNFWVFRSQIGGSLSGERRSRFRLVHGSVQANRVTEQWKIRLSASGRYNRREFDLNDSTTFVTTTRNYGTGALIVRSLGDHWSLGVRAGASSSSFINQSLSLALGPAIEFDVFPYDRSTRQLLTVEYSLQSRIYDYEEETIFDRAAETLLWQRLQASLILRQPWGSLHAGVEGSQFLHDLARHRLEAGAGFDIRLTRGLFLNVSGNVERVKDQIYLPKAGASDEEILTQRRQLGTDYRYNANFGFGYTFGSIYNSIVNPRFGS